MPRKRLRYVDSALGRTIRGMQDHGVTASEAMHVPLLVWAVIALQLVTDEQRRASPFWRQMESAAPVDIWSIALLVVIALIVSGLAIHRIAITRTGYVAAAAWWMVVGLQLWDVSRNYLFPSLFIIFSSSCLYRYGDLRREGRDDEDKEDV